MDVGNMLGKAVDTVSGSAGSLAGHMVRDHGGGKLLDKAWDLPGVKQLNSATNLDMAADPEHYHERSKGKSGWAKAGDAATLIGSAAVGGAGAAKAAPAIAKGVSKAAPVVGRVAQATKGPRTFLSGAQFGSHMSGGGNQQQAQAQQAPVDAMAGVRV